MLTSAEAFEMMLGRGRIEVPTAALDLVDEMRAQRLASPAVVARLAEIELAFRDLGDAQHAEFLEVERPLVRHGLRAPERPRAATRIAAWAAELLSRATRLAGPVEEAVLHIALHL